MANYFTDRVVEHPGRVTMTPVEGEYGAYDMERNEGTVTEAGTPFNAETFNGIAQDIIDLTRTHYGTCSTSASSATKVVACEGFQLFVGATITVYFSNGHNYNGATYLNVNSTGAKRIMFSPDSVPGSLAGLWAAGESMTFVYDGRFWIVPERGSIDVTPTITTTVGTLVSAVAYKYGRVVQMLLTIRRTEAIPSQGSIFEGEFTSFGARPIIMATAAARYAQYPIIGNLTNTGSIRIRNISSSQIPAMTTSQSLSISFTYIAAE